MKKKDNSLGTIIAGGFLALLGVMFVIGLWYGFWVLVAWLFVVTFELTYSIWGLGAIGAICTIILRRILKK